MSCGSTLTAQRFHCRFMPARVSDEASAKAAEAARFPLAVSRWDRTPELCPKAPKVRSALPTLIGASIKVAKIATVRPPRRWPRKQEQGRRGPRTVPSAEAGIAGSLVTSSIASQVLRCTGLIPQSASSDT